jgi:hypothetical protein
MGDIDASGAGGLLRRRLRRSENLCWHLRPASRLLACLRAATPPMLAVFLVACSPEYDWRDIRAPGSEYWVQLPAKPATMTRRIHLEGLAVDMTMQGARVKDNAFTVALVPLPDQSGGQAEAAGMSADRILLAMREQMLRNIGAPPATPSQEADVALVDADGRKIGVTQMHAISARGTGAHANMQMLARFVLWRGHALQIVAVGPGMGPEEAAHFLDSLRLVKQ